MIFTCHSHIENQAALIRLQRFGQLLVLWVCTSWAYAQTPSAIQTSDGRLFSALKAQEVQALPPADFNSYQAWRAATQANRPSVAPRLLEISRHASSLIPDLLQRAEAGNKLPLDDELLALYGEIAKGALPPSAMRDQAQALLKFYKDSPSPNTTHTLK